MTFNVLGTQRAMRTDRELSNTELSLLLCAALRTDNETHKVKMSLEGLANDANLSAKTAERAFKRAAVLKYFSKVERKSRAVHLWFAPLADIVSVVRIKGESSPTGVAGLSVQDDGLTVPIAGLSVQDDGLRVRPSTFTSTSVSTLESTKMATAADAPVAEDSSLQREDGTPYMGKVWGTKDGHLLFEVSTGDGRYLLCENGVSSLTESASAAAPASLDSDRAPVDAAPSALERELAECRRRWAMGSETGWKAAEARLVEEEAIRARHGVTVDGW